MLSLIIQTALRHRHLVLFLALGLIVWGGYTAAHAPLDVFPEFVQPQATIQTEAPGLSAEQVEALVTRPVESTVHGAADLESVRSESIQGLSVVKALFREGSDIHRARQALAEALGELKLPEGVKSPALEPLTSSTMDLLSIGFLSEKLSPRELRTFVDGTLRPRLLSVPGVARGSVYGGEVEQLQLQFHPERLAAFDLTLTDLLEATKAATAVRGAGFVDTPGQRIVLQTEGQTLTPAQLGEAVVRSGSPVVRLKDVATVSLGAEPRFGDATIMGKPGVLLSTSSQYGANTLAVTHALEAALADLQPVFAAQGIEVFPGLHRPATFIEAALGHMQRSLLIGSVLVAVVLLLFLLDLRTAFISFISIPLSLLAAVAALNTAGFTLNTMTLGGLAVALGIVVDDAIIDVENILRRLRGNSILPQPAPAWRVVLAATLEVNHAVVYATLIVVVVFVPVLTMSGLQGRLFAPLGWAVVLSIMASLLVALTVTPALSLTLLRGVRATPERRWIEGLRALHHDWVLAFARRPRLTAAGALGIVIAACALVPFFGGELMPEFREGHFVIGLKMRPGTSLAESTRIGRLLSAQMLANEHIATVEQQVGRAEAGEDTWGPNQSEFQVELKRGTGPEEEKEVQSVLREMVSSFPGVESEVLTFLADRIGETISGESASVVVNAFGEDLAQLDAVARRIAAALQTVYGHADVQIKAVPGAPVLSVRLRPERLAQYGFRAREVLESVETAFGGSEVAEIAHGTHPLGVAVILAEDARRDPETVGRYCLANGDGLRLPLSELADLSLTNGRSSVEHQGARRRQTVTCNVSHRDTASFVAEARRLVERTVTLPSGVYVEWSGAAEEQHKAQSELLLHCAMAFVGVLVLLGLAFPEPRHVGLILANIPFALVGGVLAVFASGSLTSIGSWVGFVTLFGISTRNSIMLISHYEHLVQEEGAPWNLETLARGAGERLVPILMTALVTALGLLPLALGGGEAGCEIESPMAVVILGGLITSTGLNLVVLPALAWRWGRFSPRLTPRCEL